MYNLEFPQNFASDFNEKRQQVAPLVRKAESKHENDNISTGESLPGVPGVSRNQKLSRKYDFYGLEAMNNFGFLETPLTPGGVSLVTKR